MNNTYRYNRDKLNRIAEQLIPTWATFNGKPTVGSPATLQHSDGKDEI